jgi:hypothetical protein
MEIIQAAQKETVPMIGGDAKTNDHQPYTQGSRHARCTTGSKRTGDLPRTPIVILISSQLAKISI